MIRNLKLLLMMPEDEICVQGEVGEEMFFIAKGECSVYVSDQNKKLHYTQELEVGEVFGEVSLMKNCRRTATVRSKQYSTLASLHASWFYELKNRFPDVGTHLEDRIKTYRDKWKRFLVRGLQNVDFLSHNID